MSKMVAVADPDYVRDLVEKHGISAELLPAVSGRTRLSENERMLTQQKDTVAYQWATEFSRIEILSRTCLYCEFVAKTRSSLKVHTKKKHLAS